MTPKEYSEWLAGFNGWPHRTSNEMIERDNDYRNVCRELWTAHRDYRPELAIVLLYNYEKKWSAPYAPFRR